MTVDLATLLAARLPTRTVELPGLGTVTVRGLSRAESLSLRKVDEVAREAHVVAIGMVDPAMTLDDVKAWQAAAVGTELEIVVTAIGDLSGLLEDSAKAAYKSNGDQP